MRYVLIVLLLTGCAEQFAKADAAALKEAGETCTKLGYSPQTQDWIDCRARAYMRMTM